jgi:hypothetical protein
MTNTSPGVIFLVKARNSALASDPIMGAFSDSQEADTAAGVFKESEEKHLKANWGDDWEHFTSQFYVESLLTDIPAEQLAAEKYQD